jgi:predicted membrane protein
MFFKTHIILHNNIVSFDAAVQYLVQEKSCPYWRFLILLLSCKNNVVKETWSLLNFIRVIVRFLWHVKENVLLNKQSHECPHSVSFKEWRNFISWPYSQPFLPDTSLIQYCLRPFSCNSGSKKTKHRYTWEEITCSADVGVSTWVILAVTNIYWKF